MQHPAPSRGSLGWCVPPSTGLPPNPARLCILPTFGWWEPDTVVALHPSLFSLRSPQACRNRLGVAHGTSSPSVSLLLPCRARGCLCQLYVRWECGREPGAFPGQRKAWGGESEVTPHPARPISRGRAGGRKHAGPCKEPPAEPAPQWPRAYSPAAPGPCGTSAPSTDVTTWLHAVWPPLGHLPLAAGSLCLGAGRGGAMET